MTTFLKIAHIVRTSYKMIRAAAGVIIVLHAMWNWFGRRLAGKRKIVQTA